MEGLKLLIFGDRSGNIISMEALLRGIEGLDIFSAITEEEAIQLCLSNEISIVLMDKKMSGTAVSGFAGLLHEHSLYDEAPVILAVTDHGLQNSINRSGANIIEYLYRPLDDTRIKTRVNLLVQMLSARRLLKGAANDVSFASADLWQKDPVPEQKAGDAWAAGADVNKDALSGKRILLAEDNELNSFMVIHMLNSWGVQADAVTNGKEALEQLALETYDLILMDTHMPVMGGYDAMRLIRTSLREPVNRIPIISLSASVMQEEQDAARRAGANDVVGKPFQPDLLHDKILSLLIG